MRRRLIVFDLDGTLVDSIADIAAALNHVLGQSGHGPLAPAVVQTLVGEGVLRLAENALTHLGDRSLSAVVMAQEISAYYLVHPCVHSRLYPTIHSVLDSLAADPALKLAVLTNKIGAVARTLLRDLSIADRFAAVVGDGDGYARKPAPEAAHVLMHRFGVSARETMMVGDGIPDLEMAHAAGIAGAAAMWGYCPRHRLVAANPTYVLEQPADLLPLI